MGWLSLKLGRTEHGMIETTRRLLARLPSRSQRFSSSDDPGTVGEDASPSEEGNLPTNFNSDSPILHPEQDEVGIDPFARAIARSIARADASAGLVYAINGVWGAGKSSAVNLVLHHLGDDIREGRISVAAFNPWWFSTPESLTMAFFAELGVTVGKSLDRQAREALAKVGSRLSAAGPFLGGLASIAATPAAGAAVAGGANLLEWMTRLDTTVEKEHRKLSDALRKSRTRYLVVLDDIDRLGTDEALQVFKLVKSAGRLPNVVYLLAYDRALADRMVAERFPAEGPSYLEKVVQGAFDLPLPSSETLDRQIVRTVEKVMGAPPDDKHTRFVNLFHDIVSPVLRTPRDAVRLGNAIEVTWPAVGSDVDRADFLALEALRLFRPEVYRTIRSNGPMLVGGHSERDRNQEETRRRYDAIFLDIVPEADRTLVEHALRRLFPRLDAVWGNLWHDGWNENRRDRLVCSPEHFSTYFTFAIPDGAISMAESQALVDGVGTPGATAARLRAGLDQRGVRGGTRTALLIAELIDRAGDVRDEDVPGLLREIFAVADDLNVEQDVAKGFRSRETNEIRLYRLTRALLIDRMPVDRRSSLVRDAAPAAALEWLATFSSSCSAIRNVRGTERDRGFENLVDDETTDWLFELSRDRLREASIDGSLEAHPNIVDLLYRWRDRTDSDEVRAWTSRRLEADGLVVSLARGAVQNSWTYDMGMFGSLGDRVAKRTFHRNDRSIGTILDVGLLDRRVAEHLGDELVDDDDRATLERYRSAPDQSAEEM